MSTPVRVIDSHTAGEPTRVVVSGGPSLGNGSTADRLRRFARNTMTFDGLWSLNLADPMHWSEHCCARQTTQVARPRSSSSTM